MSNFARKLFPLFISLFIVLWLFASLNLIAKNYKKPIITISKQDSAKNLNPKIVDFFSLGYRRFITSITWIATILESDHEHYKKRDENSWMFLRFNLISILDPKFYENYAFGGQYLSIIKDDDLGAKVIFDKGLVHYPEDYHLLEHSAFHYYFELSDSLKAQELYKKLVQFPQTKKHIVSMYAKMISQEGASEEAFQLLLDLYEKNKHIEFFEKRYRENLYSIRAEIDLRCLNAKQKVDTCRLYDFYGGKYLLKNGVYFAKENWKPFKFGKKAKNHE